MAHRIRIFLGGKTKKIKLKNGLKLRIPRGVRKNRIARRTSRRTKKA